MTATTIRTDPLDQKWLRWLLVGAMLLVGLAVGAKVRTPEATPAADEAVTYINIPVFVNADKIEPLKRSVTMETGVTNDLYLAPSDFFTTVHRPDDARSTSAYFNVVFVLVEYYYHDGKHNTFTCTLQLDGWRFSRPVSLSLPSDEHNRVTALIFPDMPASMLNEPHTWQLIVPTGSTGEQTVLTWTTPLLGDG